MGTTRTRDDQVGRVRLAGGAVATDAESATPACSRPRCGPRQPIDGRASDNVTRHPRVVCEGVPAAATPLLAALRDNL